jgi:hypothetical protein
MNVNTDEWMWTLTKEFEGRGEKQWGGPAEKAEVCKGGKRRQSDDEAGKRRRRNESGKKRWTNERGKEKAEEWKWERGKVGWMYEKAVESEGRRGGGGIGGGTGRGKQEA